MDIQHLILSIISGLVGFLIGYLTRTFMDKTGQNRDMKTVVLLVVSFAWFMSMIVEILNPNYHTNPMVHGLMGSIVGFFYNFKATPKEETK